MTVSIITANPPQAMVHLPSESYDCIIFDAERMDLHHKNCFRLIRPGGCLLLFTHDITSIAPLVHRAEEFSYNSETLEHDIDYKETVVWYNQVPYMKPTRMFQSTLTYLLWFVRPGKKYYFRGSARSESDFKAVDTTLVLSITHNRNEKHKDKPIALYKEVLYNLVKPNGTVLAPFAGYGSVGIAGNELGMTVDMIEPELSKFSACVQAVRMMTVPLPETSVTEETIERLPGFE